MLLFFLVVLVLAFLFSHSSISCKSFFFPPKEKFGPAYLAQVSGQVFFWCFTNLKKIKSVNVKDKKKVLCCVVLRCVVLCCVVFSCVVLCCVVLRCVVLCCVVLCCVVSNTCIVTVCDYLLRSVTYLPPRFERGVDPAFMLPGAGARHPHGPRPLRRHAERDRGRRRSARTRSVIDFPVAEIKRLAGIDPSVSDVTEILEALGFACKPHRTYGTITVDGADLASGRDDEGRSRRGGRARSSASTACR